jgi:hypothetical protein
VSSKERMNGAEGSPAAALPVLAPGGDPTSRPARLCDHRFAVRASRDGPTRRCAPTRRRRALYSMRAALLTRRRSLPLAPSGVTREAAAVLSCTICHCCSPPFTYRGADGGALVATECGAFGADESGLRSGIEGRPARLTCKHLRMTGPLPHDGRIGHAQAASRHVEGRGRPMGGPRSSRGKGAVVLWEDRGHHVGRGGPSYERTAFVT